MKAITICQPHAWAVVFGDKPFENRRWFCPHRGPLLIHAGLSRRWLDPYFDEYDGQPSEKDLVFGAILGVVDMAGRLTPSEILERDRVRHATAEGPWCHEYRSPRPLEIPIRCRGALGLWAVPAELARRVEESLSVSRPSREWSR